jgi:hypothetical protein
MTETIIYILTGAAILLTRRTVRRAERAVEKLIQK